MTPRILGVHWAGVCYDSVRVYDGPMSAQTLTNPLVLNLCGNLTSKLPDPYILGPNV